MARTYSILAAAILAALIGGVWLATVLNAPDDQFAQCRSGQVAGGASQIGGPFELVNAEGETVTDGDVLTGPSLIYFGYTFCPDVCPLDTARNAEVVDILDNWNYQDELTVVAEVAGKRVWEQSITLDFAKYIDRDRLKNERAKFVIDEFAKYPNLAKIISNTDDNLPIFIVSARNGTATVRQDGIVEYVGPKPIPDVKVTPVFISIDPERDTPEVVGDFAANLHERMIGLTGSPEQVKAASQAYKTYYKAQPADDEYYLVDHSTFSYLVLPEHGFVEFFRRDISPEDMADTIGCFLNNA